MFSIHNEGQLSPFCSRLCTKSRFLFTRDTDFCIKIFSRYCEISDSTPLKKSNDQISRTAPIRAIQRVVSEISTPEIIHSMIINLHEDLNLSWKFQVLEKSRAWDLIIGFFERGAPPVVHSEWIYAKNFYTYGKACWLGQQKIQFSAQPQLTHRGKVVPRFSHPFLRTIFR